MGLFVWVLKPAELLYATLQAIREHQHHQGLLALHVLHGGFPLVLPEEVNEYPNKREGERWDN